MVARQERGQGGGNRAGHASLAETVAKNRDLQTNVDLPKAVCTLSQARGHDSRSDSRPPATPHAEGYALLSSSFATYCCHLLTPWLGEQSRSPSSPYCKSNAKRKRLLPRYVQLAEARRDIANYVMLSQPRFLTKEQRAQLAIEKRQQEIKEQREKEERTKKDRETLEREAEEVRQRERERERASRYGGGGRGVYNSFTFLASPHTIAYRR